jgi:hypothetical protein
MDKSSGQLNEPSVKRVIRTVPFLQPQLLQHFVRFEKKLAIEAIKIAQVMRIEFSTTQPFDHL